MAKLIYFTPCSLDGFIAGEGEDMGWSMPSDETFAFMTELVRGTPTYLYGRKEYETMAVWERPEAMGGLPEAWWEFARVWGAAEKVVYSRTLERVWTGRTRVEREFDSGAVREMKSRLGHDASVGGPALAAEAMRAGLVDEIQLMIVPVVLGGGKRVLPEGVRLELELVEERRFENGWVYVRYGVRR